MGFTAIGALENCSQQTCTGVFAGVAQAVPPVLAYPISGATSVPDSTTTILTYFGFSTTHIELVSANATIATLPTALPNPLPGPIAALPDSSIEYEAFATGPLQANTTYSVRYDATTFTTTANGCSQIESSAYKTFGSFTTQ